MEPGKKVHVRLALLNLCRTSKGLVLEGRGCACTHAWCGCSQRAEPVHMHGVDMRKCKCYTSATPPSHFCRGEWECAQVSMIVRMRLQQTGKLSLLDPHRRKNLTAYFDLKTLYISNVIKKFQLVWICNTHSVSADAFSPDRLVPTFIWKKSIFIQR